MTNEDFLLSLNNAQQAHFNSWMQSIRAEYQAQYNTNSANLVAAKAEQIQALETALATKTTELATVQSDLSVKTTELAASSDALTLVNTSLETANNLIGAEKAKVAALEIEVTKLTAIRQYNHRWTTPDYFINRFTAHEAKAFYSSNDPIIVGGRKLLEEYEQADPPYHVDLDDAQVQGLTGYMVQLGMMTMERRTQVLSDVSAQEAFYPQ